MKRVFIFCVLMIGVRTGFGATVRLGALPTVGIGKGAGVIDPAGGYAYFIDSTTYSTFFQTTLISRIKLSNFSNSLALSYTELYGGTLPAPQGNNAAVIDPTHGFAYFIFGQQPATLVKISLSDFVQQSSATLVGAGPFSCGVIDSVNGYAYFGTQTNPALIAKVRLSDLTVVSSMTLGAGNSYLRAAVLDPADHFAYFGSSTTTGAAVKIDLTTFLQTATLTFNAGEGAVVSAFLDHTVGSIWFGTNDSPGKIVRARLSDLKQVDSLTLNANENRLTSVIYDATIRRAFLGTDTSTGTIVRINPVTMRRDNITELDAGEDYLEASAFDDVNTFGYFATLTIPSSIVKVDLIGGVPEITSTAIPDQEVPVGQTASFSVTAIGREISYQWNRNGAPISGATANVYQLAKTTLDDDLAQFNCTVSNSSGSATSGTTTLTVDPDIHVFPNPWRADRHGASVPVSFNGLPTGAVVKIFTLAAQWVRNVPESGGVATWDLKNDSGQNAASGYYLYYVKTHNDNHQIRGKFAIIR